MKRNVIFYRTADGECPVTTEAGDYGLGCAGMANSE
jgi:hypothetical protein